MHNLNPKPRVALSVPKRSLLAVAIVSIAIPGAEAAEANRQDTPVSITTITEEVVVTARRRDESLARVPIAVSALGVEQLEQRQVKSDSDLQFAVPGLTIRQTQGNNSLTYSIRGQSADTFSGSPSAVVAYINEVPLTISGASTFYDLESIQVLKGPQGTLFGRNTTGGAVLYTTAKPTNELEGKLTGRFGNLNLREFDGMVNVPIVEDKVLFRLAFNTIDRDGYIENIYPDNNYDMGDIGRDSGRITLTVKPNDRLENTTMYSYSRTDGTNTGASYFYSVYDPNNPAHAGLNTSAGQRFSSYLDSLPTGALPGDTTATWQQYLDAHPNAYQPGIIDYVNEQRRMGYYKTQYPFKADHVGEDEVLTNTTTFDVSDNLRLKNILGYTTGDADSEQPSIPSPFLIFATRNLATGEAGNETEVESFTEEFQLIGDLGDGALTYIAGIYIQQQQVDTLWPQTYWDVSPYVNQAAYVPANIDNNFRIETDTRAIYAQASYSFTEQLRLTAGFRYTEEDVTIKQLAKSVYVLFNDLYPGVYNFAEKQDESFEEPSWEIGAEYDINDELFAYIKGRGSFRSGGFNGSASPYDTDATGGGNKFDKETVKDVELGLKYRGLLLDRPATLNIALYQQWVDDVQRIEFPLPPGGSASIAVTANVPELEVKGVELETSIMPANWLELGLMATYTDAEFTDNQVSLFGTDYSYSPVANTPETTWSLWGQISFPVDVSTGDINLRIEIYGQDSMYFSNTADSVTPDTKLPSYELANVRLNWNNIMGSNFSGALFGKNVSDEEYFAGGMPLGASVGANAAAVGEPRTYGAELSYVF